MTTHYATRAAWSRVEAGVTGRGRAAVGYHERSIHARE